MKYLSEKDFGITMAFLQETEENRKKLMIGVLLDIFKKMRGVTDKKVILSTVVITRSIEFHEEKEQYETCAILKQLLEAIPDVVDQLEVNSHQ